MRREGYTQGGPKCKNPHSKIHNNFDLSRSSSSVYLSVREKSRRSIGFRSRGDRGME